MVNNPSTGSLPLVSVNVGRPAVSSFKSKDAISAIGKLPSDNALELSPEGLTGDEQADKVHHGGPDKAVCVYSFLHYPYWERVLSRSLPYGAFGENFTVDRLLEGGVCIGDIFTVGSAAVQISQPRVPCWKLAMRWGLDTLPDKVAKSGATGFYFRVLQPGNVKAGDQLSLVERHRAGVTVAESNRIMHLDKQDREGIRKLLALEDVLAMSWTVPLESRLSRLEAGGE